MQRALDRVSQNRTTVVIAHRLSTIRKADHIIVLREGRRMEEGTHEGLLKIPDGVYAGLVHAQQLEAETAPAMIGEDEVDELAEIERKPTNSSNHVSSDKREAYKQKGFFMSVGRLLCEQRSNWNLYAIILAAAIATGGEST